MKLLSENSEILTQSLLKEIEIISKRIFAIKNIFYQTSNLALRKRLLNEYENLNSNFLHLKFKVNLLNIRDNKSFNYSSLLQEKYKRCEKLISKNNKLFFV